MAAATPKGSLEPDEATRLAGTMIAGRFLIRRLIGRGGMGEVHEAEHVELGRRVAVKLLHGRVARNRSSVLRIRREARSLGSLKHPHVVEVLDAGDHDGTPYLVMELLEGEDLRTRIDRLGTLALGDAITIATQLLSGLEAVHAAGVIHRDVKPENVFLTTQEDGALFVKLLDFGVSKLIEMDSSAGNLTESGTIVGSPAFMAPEQAVGSSGIDARTDLYSVGAVLYTMLAGRPPFVAPNIPAVLLAIVEGRSEPLGLLRPSVPPGVVEMIERAMSKERGKRYRTASDFASALQPYLPTGAAAVIVPKRRGTKWRIAIGALALLLSALVGFLALRGGEPPPSRAHHPSPLVRQPVRSPPLAQASVVASGGQPPPSASAKRAILRIRLRPPRIASTAEVTLDGRRVVDLEAVVESSGAPRALVVRAQGFRTSESTVVLDADRTIDVTLRQDLAGRKAGSKIWHGPLGISSEFPRR